MTFSTALAVFLAATAAEPSPKAVRAAIDRAMPLLKAAAETHAEKKTCFACHNQAAPFLAFDAVRRIGHKLDPELRDAQVKHVREFVRKNRKSFDEGKGTGGQVDTAGWLLLTLELAGEKPDDDTAAVAGYVLQKNADRTHWACSSNRPPTEASAFATSYVAVRALKAWCGEKQKDAVAKRITAVREWAVKTAAKETEDQVFRLRLLQLCGAEPGVTSDAVHALERAQRLDGGWGQKPDLPSDAYATATVLAGLADARRPPDRRGVNYLLRTQRPDGSWFVKSRSQPFQPYYESGFPHEKDQFISASASGWAVVALASALKMPE